MESLGKKLLYFAIAIAFGSTALLSFTIINPETSGAFIEIFGKSIPLTDNLYKLLSIVATAFSTSVLLILIQLYNASKKDTAITQGSLDAKQNQSLLNNVTVMSTLKWQIENNHLGDEDEKNKLIDSLNKNTSLSFELAQTTIDISAAPIQTQIDNKQAFVVMLEKLVEQAILVGDLDMASKLKYTISVTLAQIAKISKKIE